MSETINRSAPGGDPKPLLHVAIIGGGFSGVATAVQLLRHAPGHGVRVTLVNLSAGMARGLAYGTRSPEHALNVPVGNMSVLADDAGHFLRYCRGRDARTKSADFVPRQLYGDYLEATLAQAERRARPFTRLARVVAEVVRLEAPGAGRAAALCLSNGDRLTADQVVLAVGNFPPAAPCSGSSQLHGSRCYVRDPWAVGALDGIRATDSVLLLGSGLTAVDVALRLSRTPRTAPLYCVSRRGLLPQAQPHQGTGARSEPVDALLQAMGATVRCAVHALRQYARARVQAGGDWRDVIAALRPYVPQLWRRWPLHERARFLRHVQPYWDNLRHRCAPEPHRRFSELVHCGAVRVLAARATAQRDANDRLRVELRCRGSQVVLPLQVFWVVNCTGPDADVSRAEMPLIRSLLAQGAICRDRFGLGLEVDDDGAVIDALGQPLQWLHYIGPLLKARDWEATAVPELRAHALTLALRLFESDVLASGKVHMMG
jgi:uncharacterized NAD(P)/FAD-binding protein YdhS